MRKSSLSHLTVGLIGLGQIGGSLALTFRGHGLFKEILGYDLNRATFHKARKGKLVRATAHRLRQIVGQSDIVILAVPVREIIKLLPETAKWLKPQAILCETGSTKEEILSLVEKLKIRNFIGLHPVAGTEKEGMKGWDGRLFDGKTFTITPAENCSRSVNNVIKTMIKRIGGIPLEISAREHDRIFSKTSHLPYLISIALTNTLFPQNSRIGSANFLGGAFRDATRVALSSPAVMRDILLSNSSNIAEQIDTYARILKKYRKHLLHKDATDLVKEIVRARKIRSNLQFK